MFLEISDFQTFFLVEIPKNDLQFHCFHHAPFLSGRQLFEPLSFNTISLNCFSFLLFSGRISPVISLRCPYKLNVGWAALPFQGEWKIVLSYMFSLRQ